MRFDDWDILLFPRDCKTPMKEFKVACHVVHDAEFSHTHGSIGLPTVCCFVPSLASGTPFQVSIHSWFGPTVSQYTKSYSKYTDTVKFEARLFIDGRLVASTALDQMTAWPHIIAHSFNFPKGGDLDCLLFPPFRRELLQQSFWSPADDLGRIKLVISEGFPRDSLTMPIERVKNIVSFSFQHAPLDILESSCIAWPNPSMWRRAPFASSMPVPSYPSDDPDSHAHSPRRLTDAVQGNASGYPIPGIQGVMGKPSTSSGMRRVTHPAFGTLSQAKSIVADPFGDANSYFEWLSGIGMGVNDANRVENQGNPQQRMMRRASTDISMPDYTPLESGDQLAPSADRAPFMPSMRQEEDDTSGHMRVPTNTPTTSGQASHEQDGTPFAIVSHNSSIPSDLAHSLTNSLLNQPMPLHFQQPNFHAPASEVRSRKENRRQQPAGPSPSAASTFGQDHQEMRRVSQQMYIPPGASVPVCTVNSQVNSPQDQDLPGPEQSQQGRSSDSEPGPGSNMVDVKDAAVGGAGVITAEKGTKRIRNYTPASVRAIDEEDEPRRGSPRVRLTPFTNEVPAKETV
ncbi:NADH dehydrogenase (ubiquinone)-like protein [Hirsutella rhossiliensis]|uniref:NADH dehydrogenase (Ubiquinone)-like protein n=1 Tax=Hirsutella rhossiliensis TaxID=111463 RepID=A0A9P8SHZ9_9HYPO|nr:NADH dehydrogenase (ubiquinone)-like protein [Hirsutella rhossiliensis]KAH0962674.1 NADH dehydrogenase (ubiquinone)-like protein [Hirsutella rhossiliensis]